MTHPPTHIWYDGELLATQDSGCSLLEHGLHYGTGVFEGIRCYDTPTGPAIFRLDDHLARLQAGARTLAMSIDCAQLGAAAVRGV